MTRSKTTFQNFEVYHFYSTAIYCFLKYYEKSFTVESVMMSKIQNTIQNVEVYYIYAVAIYYFSKIQ